MQNDFMILWQMNWDTITLFCLRTPLGLKINSPGMQTARIVQAVILMTIVAIAASCASTKEYTSKLFVPRVPIVKDTTPAVATLRFLDLDQLGGDSTNWVSTDDLKVKDTTGQTLQLDKLAKTLPAVPDSTLLPKSVPKPVQSEPVAKKLGNGEVRTKKTRDD
jgi:hypothetical protein